MKAELRTAVFLVIGLILVILGLALSWRLLIELVGLLLLVVGMGLIILSLQFLKR